MMGQHRPGAMLRGGREAVTGLPARTDRLTTGFGMIPNRSPSGRTPALRR